MVKVSCGPRSSVSAAAAAGAGGAGAAAASTASAIFFSRQNWSDLKTFRAKIAKPTTT